MQLESYERICILWIFSLCERLQITGNETYNPSSFMQFVNNLHAFTHR